MKATLISIQIYLYGNIFLALFYKHNLIAIFNLIQRY
jgi:hypothetical protein